MISEAVILTRNAVKGKDPDRLNRPVPPSLSPTNLESDPPATDMPEGHVSILGSTTGTLYICATSQFEHRDFRSKI
jgi:hypothetical protein